MFNEIDNSDPSIFIKKIPPMASSRPMNFRKNKYKIDAKLGLTKHATFAFQRKLMKS